MHLLAVLLFVLLSPGVLLTLPPGSKGVFMSGQTSLLAVLVHAVVFYFLVPFLTPVARRFGLEGFEDAAAPKTVPCTQQACDSIGAKCCPDGTCRISC